MQIKHTDDEQAGTTYDLSGRQMSESQLAKGIYIVRRGDKNQKVLVK